MKKVVTDFIARMTPSGSAPANRLVKMRKSVTSLRPLSGSIPVKLFSKMKKVVTDFMARMPASGSTPAKRLVKMRKSVTSLRPLSGSFP
eukprot:998495-Amphidinium_carterae.1